jgi:hypothetical protein
VLLQGVGQALQGLGVLLQGVGQALQGLGVLLQGVGQACRGRGVVVGGLSMACRSVGSILKIGGEMTARFSDLRGEGGVVRRPSRESSFS